MTDIDPAKTTKRPTPQLIGASRDNAQQDPLEDRMLYVLGLGLAGAILANAILLIYFDSLSG
jgi:hypothetical protein